MIEIRLYLNFILLSVIIFFYDLRFVVGVCRETLDTLDDKIEDCMEIVIESLYSFCINQCVSGHVTWIIFIFNHPFMLVNRYLTEDLYKQACKSDNVDVFKYLIHNNYKHISDIDYTDLKEMCDFKAVNCIRHLLNTPYNIDIYKNDHFILKYALESKYTDIIDDILKYYYSIPEDVELPINDDILMTRLAYYKNISDTRLNYKQKQMLNLCNNLTYNLHPFYLDMLLNPNCEYVHNKVHKLVDMGVIGV